MQTLKKVIFTVFISILIYSCEKDDGIKQEENASINNVSDKEEIFSELKKLLNSKDNNSIKIISEGRDMDRSKNGLQKSSFLNSYKFEVNSEDFPRVDDASNLLDINKLVSDISENYRRSVANPCTWPWCDFDLTPDGYTFSEDIGSRNWPGNGNSNLFKKYGGTPFTITTYKPRIEVIKEKEIQPVSFSKIAYYLNCDDITQEHRPSVTYTVKKGMSYSTKTTSGWSVGGDIGFTHKGFGGKVQGLYSTSKEDSESSTVETTIESKELQLQKVKPQYLGIIEINHNVYKSVYRVYIPKKIRGGIWLNYSKSVFNALSYKVDFSLGDHFYWYTQDFKSDFINENGVFEDYVDVTVYHFESIKISNSIKRSEVKPEILEKINCGASEFSI